MNDKRRRKISKIFQIDFIHIKCLLVAGLLIVFGIIGVILYLADDHKDSQMLTGSICMAVLGLLIFVFRNKLNNFMT